MKHDRTRQDRTRQNMKLLKRQDKTQVSKQDRTGKSCINRKQETGQGKT
jgi:hypothetical protein